MTSMQRDLARATFATRLDAARERQLVQRLRREKRLERRTRRRADGRWSLSRWRFGRRSATRLGADPSGGLAVVDTRPPELVAEELARLLAGIAERIAEEGTATERRDLEALADATRWTAPGAAAALVDWAGTETARLRAYGVLHGVVLGLLADEDRRWLLERLGGDSVTDDLVA